MWQWSNVKSISNPKRPSSGKDKKARACYSLEAVQICSTDFECTCFNLGTSVLVICICHLALCGIGVLPFHSPTPTHALNEIGCMMATAIYSGYMCRTHTGQMPPLLLRAIRSQPEFDPHTQEGQPASRLCKDAATRFLYVGVSASHRVVDWRQVRLRVPPGETIASNLISDFTQKTEYLQTISGYIWYILIQCV